MDALVMSACEGLLPEGLVGLVALGLRLAWGSRFTLLVAVAALWVLGPLFLRLTLDLRALKHSVAALLPAPLATAEPAVHVKPAAKIPDHEPRCSDTTSPPRSVAIATAACVECLLGDEGENDEPPAKQTSSPPQPTLASAAARHSSEPTATTAETTIRPPDVPPAAVFGLPSDLAVLVGLRPPLEAPMSPLPRRSEAPVSDRDVHRKIATVLPAELVPMTADCFQQPGPALFLCHDATGSVDHMLHLGKRVPFPVCAIALTAGTPTKSLWGMASHYVAAIRAVQPHGPYLLGGYSFGARMAFAMGQQLQAVGERVQGLVFIEDGPCFFPQLVQGSPSVRVRFALSSLLKMGNPTGEQAFQDLAQQRLSPEELRARIFCAPTEHCSLVIQPILSLGRERPASQRLLLSMARLSVAMATPGFFSSPASIAATKLVAESALVRSTDACRSRFLAELPLEGLTTAPIPADYGIAEHVTSPTGSACHLEPLALEHCDLFLTKHTRTFVAALMRAHTHVACASNPAVA